MVLETDTGVEGKDLATLRWFNFLSCFLRL